MDDLKRTLNEIVATAGGFIDYDPISLLKDLEASISYCDGYQIQLSDIQHIRIHEVIAFHSGQELYGHEGK